MNQPSGTATTEAKTYSSCFQGGSLNILKTIMENSICEEPSSGDSDHQYVSLKGCTLMHCAAQGWENIS